MRSIEMTINKLTLAGYLGLARHMTLTEYLAG